MNTRQLFINTMQAMLDNETIFMASPEFWGGVFDKIERGEGQYVDANFIIIYKTINAVMNIQFDPMHKRIEDELNLRRMLLTAIETRFDGCSISILCDNANEQRFVQSQFFDFVDIILKDDCFNGVKAEAFINADIRFLVAQNHVNRDISFSSNGELRLIGMGDQHRLFCTNATIKNKLMLDNSYFDSLCQRYASDKAVTPFVSKAEGYINSYQEKLKHSEYQENLNQSIAWALRDGA